MTIFHHPCVFPNWYLQGNVRQLIFETFCEKYPSTSGGCLNPPKFRALSNQSVVSHLKKPMDFWSTQVFMLIHVDTSGVFDVESWNVSVVKVLLFNYCKVCGCLDLDLKTRVQISTSGLFVGGFCGPESVHPNIQVPLRMASGDKGVPGSCFQADSFFCLTMDPNFLGHACISVLQNLN